MNPSLVPIVCGLLLEAANVWIYLRTDRSGIPVISIVAIGSGALTYPDLHPLARALIVAGAVALHFGLMYAVPPKGRLRNRHNFGATLNLPEESFREESKEGKK